MLITTPFHPGYLTGDLMEKVCSISLSVFSNTERFQAQNLKLCVTAGVGSDHIDLNTAVKKNVQVLEASSFAVIAGPDRD